ncbi:MAG: ABC transporter permease [Candidatus Aminicenantes bacterium]|nr:ABC transporter permease [Candidatus Aminicenantes bacterium]
MYALITIIGLSIGFALFLFFFRLYDWARSVDTFHPHVDRIHCVVQQFFSADQEDDHIAFVPPPLPSALKEEIPEIEETTRVYQAGRIIIRSGEKIFYENHVLGVDPNFMSFFNFPLLSGDRRFLLKNPHSVVLSRSLAEKYFGRENPLGKILTINHQTDVTVTGIMKDWTELPSSSSLTFSMLLSQEAVKNLFSLPDDWTSSHQTAFVRLQKNSDPAALSEKLGTFVKKYFPRNTEQRSPHKIYLMPMRQIYYFAPHIQKYDNSNFSPYSIFLVMGIVFLLLVGMNYINLATARTQDRVKEIGLRKVVGANRKQLLKQFLCESVLIAFLALPLSFLAYELISAFLMARLGLHFNLSLWSRAVPVLVVFLLPAVTGLLSGIYPAFVVSSFRPIQMLKGRLMGKSRRRSQKFMVVSQFVLCTFFLVLGFVWFKQTRHIFTADLGYNRANVWVVPLPAKTLSRLDVFREQVKKNSNISAVSASKGLPGNWRKRMNVTSSAQPEQSGWTMYAYGVGHDFFDLLDMNIISGRAFQRATNDSNTYIINQAAANLFGWKDPIGKTISAENQKGRIIGVIGEFRFENVHYPSGPAVFFLEKERVNFLLVRSNNHINRSKLTAKLGENWSAIFPDMPFEVFSLDDHFHDVYFNETTLISEIISGIGGFAVFLSCLGLLALVAYSVRKRTKEIAVRKVLGASITNILEMLGRDFLKFVFLSDVIALPISYYLSLNILKSAYTVRTTIDAGILLLTVFLTFTAAAAAIASQTFKAAAADPVDSLRHE